MKASPAVSEDGDFFDNVMIHAIAKKICLEMRRKIK